MLSLCPMLEGTPFSMSFKMLLSNASAATRKKKSCTFSPKNIHIFFNKLTFLYTLFLNYVTVVCNTASGVRLKQFTSFRGNSPKLCTHFCCYLHSIFLCLLPFLWGLGDKNGLWITPCIKMWNKYIENFTNGLTRRSLFVPTRKMKQESGSFSLTASFNHCLQKWKETWTNSGISDG